MSFNLKKTIVVMPLLLGGLLVCMSQPMFAQDTGTEDTGTTRDTGTPDTGEPGSGGTVTAGPAEEVIVKTPDGKTRDVTNNPNDAFPAGSQVPNQQNSTASPTSEDSSQSPYVFKKSKGKLQRR